jgi:hypothetical protein
VSYKTLNLQSTCWRSRNLGFLKPHIAHLFSVNFLNNTWEQLGIHKLHKSVVCDLESKATLMQAWKAIWEHHNINKLHKSVMWDQESRHFDAI